MKNVKEIKIEVKGKEWQTALDKAFNNKKKDIKVDGFRKGACPRDVYIKKVGIEALFMDACDIAIEGAYQKALKDADIEIVTEPSVSIEKVEESGAVFVFTLVGRPEVKLGDYKKLGVKREKVKVTKEEVNHEIEHLREHMAEVVIKEKGKVENGNTAVIDFEGKVDGEVIQGGTGTDFALEIGSHTFIPGFEEGVVGMKLGETKDLNLKFPDDYTPELKGKDVVFKVTVKEIKEKVKPELDADFFDDLGIEGVDSVDKLESHIEEELKEAKEREADDKYIDELLHIATDNMTVDINNEIIDGEVKRMISQYNQELQRQGITLEQYLTYTGSKMEDVETMMKPQAIARIKTRYLLEEVVKVEKIEVSDKEIDEEIKKVCTEYDMKEEDFLNAVGGKDMVRYDLTMRKAIEIIKEG